MKTLLLLFNFFITCLSFIYGQTYKGENVVLTVTSSSSYTMTVVGSPKQYLTRSVKVSDYDAKIWTGFDLTNTYQYKVKNSSDYYLIGKIRDGCLRVYFLNAQHKQYWAIFVNR